MTTTKLDIWIHGKSQSVRLPVHVANAFKAKASAFNITLGFAATTAQRDCNGTLAEAITEWVKGEAIHTTREAYIGAAVELMRPVFAGRGYPLPDNIRATIAFTSKGWSGKHRGECWVPDMAADGAVEIMVCITESETSEIVSILTHELAHAAQGRAATERAAKLKEGTKAQASMLKAASGHGKVWKEVAAAVDLVPVEKETKGGTKEDWTRAHGGDAWKVWAQPIIDQLGKCPHAALAKQVKKEAEEGKQTTRMLKLVHEDCDIAIDNSVTWRMSAKHIRDMVQVACPCCGKRIDNPHYEGAADEDDEAEPETDPENIYNRPSIRKSINEDLARVGKPVTRKQEAETVKARTKGVRLDGRSPVRKMLDDAAHESASVMDYANRLRDKAVATLNPTRQREIETRKRRT